MNRDYVFDESVCGSDQVIEVHHDLFSSDSEMRWVNEMRWVRMSYAM